VTVSGNTTTLAYDFENRLTMITYPSTATNTFTYNALGTRVGKVDSVGNFTYKRDGANVTDPVLNDGAAQFTPGISERRGGTTKFYHQNDLGTVSRITNTSQSTTDTKQYDAFGVLVSSSGSTPTPFGFAGAWGYQEDADSGLKLLGHRYYDPSSGRFLTRDPVNEGRNWYSYCHNRPLVGVDPSGTVMLLGISVNAPIPGFSYGGSGGLYFDDNSWRYYGGPHWGQDFGVGSGGPINIEIGIRERIVPGYSEGSYGNISLGVLGMGASGDRDLNITIIPWGSVGLGVGRQHEWINRGHKYPIPAFVDEVDALSRHHTGHKLMPIPAMWYEWSRSW